MKYPAATHKSILITGCSSGIGLACARTMRERGWRVLATARKADDLAMLKAAGFEPIALELEDEASVAACADAALERTEGRLFGVFNNAAYGQPGAVEDLRGDVLRRQFETNVFSWHDLTCRLLPAMRAEGRGRIVQCSSVLGFISPPWRGAYNASKHALEALANAMRAELNGSASGIHVSIIQPGPIESRFVDRALAELLENVDLSGSAHAETYRTRVEGLKSGGSSRWKLPADAVARKLIHALESPRPRNRYKVTVPTHLAALGLRLLPQPLADRMVAGS